MAVAIEEPPPNCPEGFPKEMKVEEYATVTYFSNAGHPAARVNLAQHINGLNLTSTMYSHGKYGWDSEGNETEIPLINYLPLKLQTDEHGYPYLMLSMGPSNKKSYLNVTYGGYCGYTLRIEVAHNK